MVSSLHQANANHADFASLIECPLHQTPANRRILGCWVDSNGTDSSNRRVRPKEIAPDDPLVQFGNNRMNRRLREHIAHQILSHSRGREIGGKIVALGDAPECLVANGSAPLGVFLAPRSQHQWRNGLVVAVRRPPLLRLLRRHSSFLQLTHPSGEIQISHKTWWSCIAGNAGLSCGLSMKAHDHW